MTRDLKRILRLDRTAKLAEKRTWSQREKLVRKETVQLEAALRWALDRTILILHVHQQTLLRHEVIIAKLADIGA